MLGGAKTLHVFCKELVSRPTFPTRTTWFPTHCATVQAARRATATYLEVDDTNHTEGKALLERGQIAGRNGARQVRHTKFVAIAVDQAHRCSEFAQVHAGECDSRSGVRLRAVRTGQHVR
jgi:hypothetical protein